MLHETRRDLASCLPSEPPSRPLPPNPVSCRQIPHSHIRTCDRLITRRQSDAALDVRRRTPGDRRRQRNYVHPLMSRRVRDTALAAVGTEPAPWMSNLLGHWRGRRGRARGWVIKLVADERPRDQAPGLKTQPRSRASSALATCRMMHLIIVWLCRRRRGTQSSIES